MARVAIIGAGNVGAASAFAMVMKGSVGVREIVLVDIDKKRAQAEADDILHATPFASAVKVVAGDYPAIHGARVVVLCCGVAQKPGETRLQLLQRNAKIFGSVVPQVLEHAPEAVLVVVANPVDVLTAIAAFFAKRAGVPSSRVIGSGTMLDTARFRALLGAFLNVDAPHVHASVLGEHGDSEVVAWSDVTVGGLSLAKYCELMAVKLPDAERARISEGVTRAAYSIIDGKGSTCYGIGSCVAKLVSVLLHSQRAILTICSLIENSETMPELNGVTLSLPHVVSEHGAVAAVPVDLEPAEREQLLKSAAVLRDSLASLKLDEMFPKADAAAAKPADK